MSSSSKDKKPKKVANAIPAYATFPLAQNGDTDPATGTTVPPPDAVREAKEWVDFNKK